MEVSIGKILAWPQIAIQISRAIGKTRNSVPYNFIMWLALVETQVLVKLTTIADKSEQL